MEDYYTEKNGVAVPCGLDEWATRDKRVDETTVGDLWISTVFLGMNHNFGPGAPLLYETMVFPTDGSFHEFYCDRYSTREQAIAGHAETVAKVKAGEITATDGAE